jgi:hypothetical protein
VKTNWNTQGNYIMAIVQTLGTGLIWKCCWVESLVAALVDDFSFDPGGEQ